VRYKNQRTRYSTFPCVRETTHAVPHLVDLDGDAPLAALVVSTESVAANPPYSHTHCSKASSLSVRLGFFILSIRTINIADAHPAKRVGHAHARNEARARGSDLASSAGAGEAATCSGDGKSEPAVTRSAVSGNALAATPPWEYSISIFHTSALQYRCLVVSRLIIPLPGSVLHPYHSANPLASVRKTKAALPRTAAFDHPLTRHKGASGADRRSLTNASDSALTHGGICENMHVRRRGLAGRRSAPCAGQGRMPGERARVPHTG
jgi:hypothetical protein